MDTNDWVAGDITLNVAGMPLQVHIAVPSKPVKPQVMLPVFQNMANTFTDFGVAQVEKSGETVSCQKGCGACCRQPVPLAEIEIYHIAAVVASLPAPRQAEVRQKFAAGAAHFQALGWGERFDACTEEADLKKVVLQYFFEHVACPFLEDESCSIHPFRPVACREYLVTSPKEFCANPVDEATIRQIPMPIKASDGLPKMVQTNHLSDKKFLPMIFALDWAEKYPESFEEKRGEEWLSDFFAD